MSRLLTARWVLPIDRPPIAGGWVEVQGGRIAAVGAPPVPGDARDLGDVALLPGLVNAHTHLELSWLAGKVPPSDAMSNWIRALLAARAVPVPAAERAAAIVTAVEGLRDTGTVLVGDVSNTLEPVPALARSGLGGVVFYELLGFNIADPALAVREAWGQAARVLQQPRGPRTAAPRLRVAVVAHAPYTVSPALFHEIARRRREDVLSVHVGESVEEIEFLRTGEGPFRQLLNELGAWSDAWTPPACDPVEYLDRLGYVRPGLLAVHGVHLKEKALERLAQSGATLVTCPRSNEWVGAGMPPVSRFYASGVPVAIGTDSLASAPSLNLFDELAELRRVAPDVSAASLLESATRIGAEALGFGQTHGTLAPGKRAALVAVDVPADVNDVEEYLVGGIPASAVRPLRL